MKPSPPQARLLRLLAKYPRQGYAYIRGGKHSSGAEWDYGAESPVDTYMTWHHDQREAALKGLRQASILGLAEARLLEMVDQSVAEWTGYVHGQKFVITQAGIDIVQMLAPEDFESKTHRVDALPASFMLNALAERYARSEGWLFFREWVPGSWEHTHGRRIDAFAFNRWSSRGYARIAFEVKRSRQDFRSEVATPEKRAPALGVATQFFFVCPAGVIEGKEVPEETGLLWVYDTGEVRQRKAGPDLPGGEPTWDFLGAVVQRLVEMDFPRSRAQE